MGRRWARGCRGGKASQAKASQGWRWQAKAGPGACKHRRSGRHSQLGGAQFSYGPPRSPHAAGQAPAFQPATSNEAGHTKAAGIEARHSGSHMGHQAVLTQQQHFVPHGVGPRRVLPGTGSRRAGGYIDAGVGRSPGGSGKSASAQSSAPPCDSGRSARSSTACPAPMQALTPATALPPSQHALLTSEMAENMLETVPCDAKPTTMPRPPREASTGARLTPGEAGSRTHFHRTI